MTDATRTQIVDVALVEPCVLDEHNSEVWDTLNEQEVVWEYLMDAGAWGVWINGDYDPLGPVIVLVDNDEGLVACHAYNKGAYVGEVTLPSTEVWPSRSISLGGPYDAACKVWAHLNREVA